MSQSTSNDQVRNVIIVGSGPAGYTAAVYAARASLQPLVFEGSVTAGGALMNTTEVENFPGFRDGIMGPALMDEMRAQAERFGAELVSDDVIAVDLTGDVKTVTHRRPSTYSRARGDPRDRLGLPQARPARRGASSPAAASRWCATCDGFFFREQHIAVVGGGDSAIEEATFLTRFGSKVTADPPPRRAARLQDHAGAGVRRPEDRVHLELRGRRDPRRRAARGAHPARHRPTGAERELAGHRPVHRDRPRPALGAAHGPGRPRRRGLRARRRTPRRPPTCPASSPAATSSTTTTGRRSPPPAPAAPPPSTPSATSPSSTTPRRPVPTPRRRGRLRGQRRRQDRRSLSRSAPRRRAARVPSDGTSVGTMVFTQVTPAGVPDAQPPRLRTTGRIPVANLAAVTDADFEADGAQVRQAGPGRLLGRVVRSVPPGRPDPRRARAPSTATRSPS